MYNILQIQFRLGLLIATFGLVVSCLITNCPRGGKRSEELQSNVFAEHNANYCIPCGIANQGVCLGKNVCCSRDGCIAGPRHAKACRNVQDVRLSCLSELNTHTCGDNGRCRAKYLCCTKDQCMMDPSCKTLQLGYKDFSEQILSSLLQKTARDVSETNQDVLNEIWKSKNDFSPPMASDYDS